jgi:hypothetical protein
MMLGTMWLNLGTAPGPVTVPATNLGTDRVVMFRYFFYWGAADPVRGALVPAALEELKVLLLSAQDASHVGVSVVFVHGSQR